jgi:glyoxylase-like metal-dependent hydrolase (beta-lactamase superfamily II)
MNMNETTPLSRRQFLASAGVLGAAAWLTPGRLAAAQATIPEMMRRAAAVDPIVVSRLRGGMAVLTGAGGNITALPGADGVLLIDSGIVPPKVAAAVATFTRTPIRHVVNTHWHFDHTDGNGWLAARGARVMAHEKTRERLSRDTRVEDWNFTFRRTPPAALPSIVVRPEQTLQLNGTQVALAYYDPAHTDTDVVAHFTGADVISAGDTWWNGTYPFIDYSTGGSINGIIAAMERTLARASASTLIVPGHGAVGSRVELARDRDMLVAIRDRVAALKRQGRSMAEVVAAKPTAPYDRRAGGTLITPDFFTRLAYKGV